MTGTLDTYLAHRFDWRPVDATFMGASGHDHRLPRTGAGAAEAELAEVEALLARVEADDAMDATDRQMLLAELRVEASSLQFRPRHRNPAWHTGEAAFGVISLLLPQSRPWRADAIAARLAAIPGFLSDGLAAIGDVPVPTGWASRAQAECAALATFLREDMPLHEAWDPAWSAPAETAAQAFELYSAALVGLPDTDPACGTAHLELVMREQHRLDFGADEAVARARAAFDSTRVELEEMARAIDPEASWQDQIAALSRIHPDDEAGVLAEVMALDAQAASAADGLVTPDTGYGLEYRPFPDWARTVSKALYFLFYRSPPGLNPGQGSTYWVSRAAGDVPAYLAANSTAMLKTVHAVHHGTIGHHTQNARARQAPSRLARIAGTDCAMGLAFLGAGTLIEGWACHVEDVLIEAPGFYSPAEVLLLKSFERRNAASVLVDVNLHTGAWSADEAARFYAEEAGFAPARVTGEIIRNSMFPGSRLMYWIGVEGIRDLRRRWTGSTQDFHDTLLSLGHVPLATVAEHMDRQGIPRRMSEPLLDIRGLVTEFRTEGGLLRAVKGVDLTIERGETLALVGESGSGKSVTSLSAMRLIPERVGRIAQGEILFRGRDGAVRDLTRLSQRQMSDLRGSEIAMIFQEPMTSLNPAHRIGTQIAEAARLHEGLGEKAARARAVEMLRLVEIPEPERRAEAYPHQLSGGMRQRVMIASALVCNPSLLIADEPTTALDSTVQLQILVLLKRLQEEFRMGILFITHNLGVVAEIADRVAVMYGGRIVEDAPVAQILEAPRHPYTRGLLGSVPRTDHAARAGGARERLAQIPGSMVDPLRPPPGCDFEPRCAWAVPACRSAVPPLDRAEPEGHVRCIRWREIA